MFSDRVMEMDARMVERLGEPMTVTTTAGSIHQVLRIFDRFYAKVGDDDPGPPGVSSAAPGVFFRLQSGNAVDRAVNGSLNYLPVDPTPESNLRVTFVGVTYVAREVQKDGLGGVWLALQKA